MAEEVRNFVKAAQTAPKRPFSVMICQSTDHKTGESVYEMHLDDVGKYNQCLAESEYPSKIRYMHVASQGEKTKLPACIANMDVVFLSINNYRHKPMLSAPTSIAGMIGLRELCLSDHWLKTLPIEFGNLVHLERLDLCENKFKEVPLAVHSMKRLKSLNLRGNSLSMLPDWIGELKNLKDLDISWTKISALPRSLASISLTELDMDSCNLTELPENIELLVHLEDLDLARNDIQDCSGLAPLRKLRRLDLWRNICEFPDDLCDLVHLEYLNISENGRHINPRSLRLPRRIGNLQKLTYLRAKSNGFTELPPSFAHLRLQVLNLAYNPLKSVTFSDQLAETLMDLNLSNTELQAVPSNLGKMRELQVANFSSNQLREFHLKECLPNLKELRLSYNQLESFSLPTERIPNLAVLDVSKNPKLDITIETFLAVAHLPLPSFQFCGCIHAPEWDEIMRRVKNHVVKIYEIKL